MRMFPRTGSYARLTKLWKVLTGARFVLGFQGIVLVIAGQALGQQAPPVAPEAIPGKPDPIATLAYIHQSWDQLSRSMTDCHSLVDVKVTSNPVLYLPAEIPVPETVKGLSASCGVKAVALPKRISALGDLRPEELVRAGVAPGLLYLP